MMGRLKRGCDQHVSQAVLNMRCTGSRACCGNDKSAMNDGQADEAIVDDCSLGKFECCMER